jgi:hypothetical protein
MAATMHGPSNDNLSDRRRRLGLLAACCGALLAAWGSAPLHAQDTPEREYKVKSAFVYNFLKFVVGGRFGPADDKAESDADPNEIILVGVVGKTPSKESFTELQGKLVRNKRVRVRLFKGFEDLKDSEQKIPEQHPQMAEIRKCHVLFVCPSEKPFWSRILPPLQKEGMLLVGDTPGFLEAGGIINLVIEDNKVRFEVNLAAAARGKLQIRSSLLRLAIRTVEHDPLEKQDHEDR